MFFYLCTHENPQFVCQNFPFDVKKSKKDWRELGLNSDSDCKSSNRSNSLKKDAPKNLKKRPVSSTKKTKRRKR